MPTEAIGRRKTRMLGTLIVLGILFLLFGFGSMPASGHLVPGPWDKVVHMAVFATLALGMRMLMPGLPVWLLFTLGAVIGVADEIHQTWVPTRQPGWDDGMADLLGIMIGLLAWYPLKRI